MPRKEPLWTPTDFKPWGLQSYLKQQNIETENDIKLIAVNNFKSIDKMYIRNRSLFILTYLTAGRITEVLNLKKKDLIPEYKRGRAILLIRLINKKNKKKRFKDLPIPTDREGVLLDLLSEHLKTLKDNDFLFPVYNDSTKKLGRSMAYKVLRHHTNFNCHWIRHLRLTHLVVNHDFNEQLLMRFAGWSSGTTAQHYMELRWEDFLDKF